MIYAIFVGAALAGWTSVHSINLLRQKNALPAKASPTVQRPIKLAGQNRMSRDDMGAKMILATNDHPSKVSLLPAHQSNLDEQVAIRIEAISIRWFDILMALMVSTVPAQDLSCAYTSHQPS